VVRNSEAQLEGNKRNTDLQMKNHIDVKFVPQATPKRKKSD
jgi:hypothetical protein